MTMRAINVTPAAINSFNTTSTTGNVVQADFNGTNVTTRQWGNTVSTTTRSVAEQTQAEALDWLKQVKTQYTDLMQKAQMTAPTVPPKSAEDIAKIQTMIGDWMRQWERSANDAGGHNSRETAALNAMRSALTDAATYMSVDQVRQMLDGAQAVTGRIKGFGGRFEDGAFKEIVSYAQNAGKPYQDQFKSESAQIAKQAAAAERMLGQLLQLMDRLKNMLSVQGAAASNSTTEDTTGSTTPTITRQVQAEALDWLKQARAQYMELLSTARSTAPTVPKRSDAEIAQVQAMINEWLAQWEKSANDRKGHNSRESQALGEMRSALTKASNYLTVDQTRQMLDGAQALAGRIKGFGGRFEDGAFKEIVNFAQNFAKPYEQQFESQSDQINKKAATAERLMGILLSLLDKLQGLLNAPTSDTTPSPTPVGNGVRDPAPTKDAGNTVIRITLNNAGPVRVRVLA